MAVRHCKAENSTGMEMGHNSQRYIRLVSIMFSYQAHCCKNKSDEIQGKHFAWGGDGRTRLKTHRFQCLNSFLLRFRTCAYLWVCMILSGCWAEKNPCYLFYLLSESSATFPSQHIGFGKTICTKLIFVFWWSCASSNEEQWIFSEFALWIIIVVFNNSYFGSLTSHSNPFNLHSSVFTWTCDIKPQTALLLKMDIWGKTWSWVKTLVSYIPKLQWNRFIFGSTND